MTILLWVMLVGGLAVVGLAWWMRQTKRRAPAVDAAPLETPALALGGDGVVPVDGTISPEALLERIDRGERLVILDVRFEGEFAAGHVPGALNVPFMQVSTRIASIPGSGDDELIVYCGHGPRAYVAASALRRGGRTRIVYMSGHWAGWQAAGLRVES